MILILGFVDFEISAGHPDEGVQEIAGREVEEVTRHFW